MTGDRTWVVLAEGPEPDVDAAIARQRGFDPDLWVIEVEDRDGRHLLDRAGPRRLGFDRLRDPHRLGGRWPPRPPWSIFAKKKPKMRLIPVFQRRAFA